MLHDRPALPGSVTGGAAGRRVVTRWARRLLRREWRQQILVLALLALTVGAATFSVAAAYNVASLPGPQFGSANYLLQFAGTGQKTIDGGYRGSQEGVRHHSGDWPPVRGLSPAPPRPSSTGR